MATCLVRSASKLSCQIPFAGRRSKRLDLLKEQETSLATDGIYEQPAAGSEYLKCKLPAPNGNVTRLTCLPT